METVLDDLLKFLNKQFHSIPFDIPSLIEEIGQYPAEPVFKHELEMTTVRTYLDYLVHKNYVVLYSKNPLNYKLDSLGKIFIKTGGFTREKEIEQNFRRSSLDTNASVQLTNTLTQQSILTQRNISYATFLVSVIALAFSAIALFRDTDSATRQINTTLEKHLRSLDSIPVYLKK